MVATTKEFTLEERSTVKDSFNGLMEPSMTENGETTKCMAKASFTGVTEGFTKAITIMIKSTAKASICGRMVECILGGFIMVSSTEKVYTSNRMVKKYTVFGKKARKTSFVKIDKNTCS